MCCTPHAGGALGQAIYNRRKQYLPLLIGACVTLGILPVLYIINADLRANIPATVFMVITAGAPNKSLPRFQ